MSGPIDTERLRALLAASTPGPWAVPDWGDSWVLPEAALAHRAPYSTQGHPHFIANNAHDATLVAEALTALPGLLDEVERLDRALVEVPMLLARADMAFSHEDAEGELSALMDIYRWAARMAGDHSATSDPEGAQT